MFTFYQFEHKTKSRSLSHLICIQSFHLFKRRSRLLSESAKSMCPTSQVILSLVSRPKLQIRKQSKNCRIRIFYSLNERNIIRHSTFLSARLFHFHAFCFSIVSASRPL